MELLFWGATRTVTGSAHYLRVNGRWVVLDFGLFQGRRAEARRRNRTLPREAGQIEAVLLSHAHIDHSGNLPTLARLGFSGTVYATAATRDLCTPMLLDSAHLQEADVRFVNKRRARKGEPPVEPLYTQEDAVQILRQIVGVPYGRTFWVAPGVWARFLDAGHILGSAAVVLELEEDGERIRLGFSGDVGRKGLPILRDPEPLPPVDYLILESTYGNRLHESPDRAKEALAQVVRRTVERGGKVLIPAFAVGRTQEIVYHLHELFLEGRLPRVPIYVDSPLASAATSVFRLHPECYDRETWELLAEIDRPGADPFGFRLLRYLRSTEESMALNDDPNPAVIIAASGMCEGGRILHHLRHHVGNPKNTVLIVSFQAEHTLGRRLAEGWKKVNIYGEPHVVRAEVVVAHGYSAHADRQGLLDYARPVLKEVKGIFLVHGEPEAQEALAEGLRSLGARQVWIPQRGDRVRLTRRGVEAVG